MQNKIKNTKNFLIIGITAFLIITAINPNFIKTTKADPPIYEDLTVTTNVGDSLIYETTSFSVSVKCGSTPVTAHVYYQGHSNTGSTVSFNAESVNSPKDVPVEHTIRAECEFDSDGDGVNETHEGRTTIYVCNRYLVVSSIEVNDNEGFKINVKDQSGGGVDGVSVSFNGGSKTTGLLGNTLTKFTAPTHAKNTQSFFEYPISASKDDFIGDSSATL